jgi:hypothetical protein
MKIKESKITKTQRRKIIKSTQTQSRKRKEKVDSKQSIDELVKDFEKISLGKTVHIIAAIWGHGGQCVIGKNMGDTPFFQVRKNIQTNILGLGFSGICTMISSQMNAQIDNTLKTNPKGINTKNISKAMIEITKGYIEHRKEETNPILVAKEDYADEELYSYVMNYGKDKKRCNKIYSAYKTGDPFLPNQLRNGKLLVRIYSINLPDSLNFPLPYDLYFNDGISLNQIVDTIASEIDEIVKKMPSSNKIEKLDIHLFDSTCNYTSEITPNIPFTDTAKQRTMKGIVKTTAKEQNMVKKRKELEAKKTELMEISTDLSPLSSSKESSKKSRSTKSITSSSKRNTTQSSSK